MAADGGKPIDLSKIRNIGVIAHIDAGKTTTTEHLLYYAGAKHRLGTVDEGTTETDWNVEEQERGITIYSACIPFQWRDCTVNFIDTPGHVDFTAEVERSLRVLDGCVVVFDAQKGVEAQSETVWRQADKYHVPRLVFINKMDVVGANFSEVWREIRTRLEGAPVPVVVPIGAGSPKDSAKPFAGVIDLIEMQALYFDPADQGKTYRREPIPEEERAGAAAWREEMLNLLSAKDDALAVAFLAELEGKGAVPAEEIRRILREQTLKQWIQPVLCGSGREHMGIQPLLDAVAWYLPSPLDRPPVAGVNPKKKDKEERRKPDPKEPFCGLVFKVVAGASAELFYVRIYSGTLRAGKTRPYNTGRNVKELVGKIYHTMADPKDRQESPEALAGDIVALIGLKDSITGDTLCDFDHPILLERIQFAEAVFSRSIEPESSADKDKLASVLHLLCREDPTFQVRIDAETGQTMMSGMGKLHLEIKQHRMERDFKLKVRVGKPRVSYRETLKKPLSVVGECVRQAGASGLFAKIHVDFEPLPGSQSIQVQWDAPPEQLPPEFLTAAEQGVRGALESGELGYPVMSVRAILRGGEIDQQLSNETAFQAAGDDAVRKAMRDNIVLLEPVLRVEVTLPQEFLGPVTADLNAKRGEIEKLHSRGGVSVLGALVPDAKMFDYADEVRSLSQGRASPSLEPHSYRPAPPEVLNAMLHPEDY
jgi:elongation factor G